MKAIIVGGNVRTKFQQEAEPSWRVTSAKDEANSDDEMIAPHVRICCCNIGVIPYPMEGRVDIVLVEENLCRWVKDADVPDMSPVPALDSGVKCSGNISGVTLVHEIIEGTGISVLVNVTGGVDHNPSFAVAEDEIDRQ